MDLDGVIDAAKSRVPEAGLRVQVPVINELEEAKDPEIIYGLDTTLSQAGRAAEAAAVGTALADKFGSEDVIPVANGGTGATTAAAALTNLGAAAASHNHSASFTINF